MTLLFDVNKPVNTSFSLAFRLKALLKSAGWTVPSSSDGTTYNTSGDQITQAGSGANGLANSNAWFRVQDPAGVREFCFQSSGSPGSWKIKYSASSKFITGSPNASTFPNAVDEKYLIGSIFGFNPWMSSTENSYRWNGAADNAAPYGFWSVGFEPNAIENVNYNGVLVMDPMSANSYPAGDLDPVVIVCSSQTSTFTNLGNISDNQRAWLRYGSLGAGFQQVQALFHGNNSSQWIPSRAAGWFHQNYKVFSYPLFWGRPNIGQPNPPNGWKGQSSLMNYTSSRLATATAFGIISARDRIAFGDINLPWNGSFPLI